MLTFYTDEDVDGPIIEGIRARGVDVLTLQEDGRSGLRPDSLVLDRATELGRVLISHDKHLIQEGTRRQREGIYFAGLIHVPKVKARWGWYIEDLVLIAEAEEPSAYENYIEYLPL